MASCGYFFASLRQRSCSSQCRYRSVNAVTKMHCCSERKAAFVQPFCSARCSARCSANKSLKQRCFNVSCIVRVISLPYNMKIISRLKGVLKQRLILGISIFQKKSLEWFKNYSLICKVDWNVSKTINKTVVDPDLQFREGRRGEVGPVWKKILFWPQFGLKIRGGGDWGYGGVCIKSALIHNIIN